MIKFLFTSIILLYFLSTFSQVNPDNIKGTITRENTDIKFLSIKVAPWDILLSESRMTFAGGFGGKFYLNGLYINANYTYHYVDDLAKVVGGPIIGGSSIYLSTKSRDADATIGYFFQKKTNGVVKIRIGSSGTGRMRSDYYAKVLANYNKLLGLQVGYKQGFANLTIPEGVIVRDAYLFPNEDIKTKTGLNTYMQYGWFSFGATYGKTIDVEVDLEKYGHKKAQYIYRYYANLLVSKYSKLEDVYFIDYYNYKHTVTHQYILDGNVKMSNLGFNLGLETYSFNKVGVTYGVELGIMPGVQVSKAGNFYFSLKWGIVIGKAFGGKQPIVSK